MADLHKYTTKEVLNKVFRESGGDAVGVNSGTANERLALVLDDANSRLNVELEGGTVSGNLHIEGNITVDGTTTLDLDAIGVGKVGIGIDSPDSTLHVMSASAGSVTVAGEQANGIIAEHSDVASLTLLSPNDGLIYFGDVADTDIGRIGYRHGGDYANSMYFWTNNAQRMTIDDAGKVGIGIADPLSLLHLNTATEALEIVDAGSASASEQDWIEVEVGGVQGYIRVYSSK